MTTPLLPDYNQDDFPLEEAMAVLDKHHHNSDDCAICAYIDTGKISPELPPAHLPPGAEYYPLRDLWFDEDYEQFLMAQ